jgi:1,4-alpha-glucan branching enzyme
MKWDLGWMHDTLSYLAHDPVHRKYHHNLLTFRPVYAGSENFILPLSHDEVVYMKGSLVGKMPGDDWQKFATVRLLLAYQAAVPGKKLLFMGNEIAQWGEWDHDTSLQWHLLEWPPHAGMQRLVADLNRLHREVPELHERDFDPNGFQWVDCTDFASSVITFLRFPVQPGRALLAAFNFTPVPRAAYRVGVPFGGTWKEILNTDAVEYAGSGSGNYGSAETRDIPGHGRPFSLELTLPPLAAVFFQSPGQQGSDGHA